MNYTKDAVKTAKDLLDFFELSDYEALSIAVKIQQNELYAQANVIEKNQPSALEAIAMQLGAGAGRDVNLLDVISDISNSIGEK